MHDSVTTSSIRAKGEEDGNCAYRNDGAKQVKAAGHACVYFSLSLFLHPQNICSWFAYSRCCRRSSPARLCALYTPLWWIAHCLISAPFSPNFNTSSVHFQEGGRWHFPLKIPRLDQLSCYHVLSLISSPNSVCVPTNHPPVNLQKMPPWLSAFSGSSRCMFSLRSLPRMLSHPLLLDTSPHLDKLSPPKSLAHHGTTPNLTCEFARHTQEPGHGVARQPILESGSTGKQDASRQARPTGYRLLSLSDCRSNSFCLKVKSFLLPLSWYFFRIFLCLSFFHPV